MFDMKQLIDGVWIPLHIAVLLDMPLRSKHHVDVRLSIPGYEVPLESLMAWVPSQATFLLSWVTLSVSPWFHLGGAVWDELILMLMLWSASTGGPWVLTPFLVLHLLQIPTRVCELGLLHFQSHPSLHVHMGCTSSLAVNWLFSPGPVNTHSITPTAKNKPYLTLESKISGKYVLCFGGIFVENGNGGIQCLPVGWKVTFLCLSKVDRNEFHQSIDVIRDWCWVPHCPKW